MGLALVAGLSTSCSNGDWEDSLDKTRAMVATTVR